MRSSKNSVTITNTVADKLLDIRATLVCIASTDVHIDNEMITRAIGLVNDEIEQMMHILEPILSRIEYSQTVSNPKIEA